MQAQSQGEEQVADALRPYGQFADVQRARLTSRSPALARTASTGSVPCTSSRLRSPQRLSARRRRHGVSRCRKSLTAVAAGSVGNMREKTQAPAFALTGCTYSPTRSPA